MKKTLIAVLSLAVVSLAGVNADSFTAGTLSVARVGNGTVALANSAGPISILEFTSTGTLVQTINIPSGDGGLQVSGSATGELAISRSADNTQLIIAGYVPPYTGTGGLQSRNATAAPRGFVSVNNDAVISSTTTLNNSYSGLSIRSGVSSGTNFWFAGTNGGSGGLVYSDGTSQTQITNINSRVVSVHNGSLYYSTGSGTQGIYSFSGLPTTSTNGTAYITGVVGQGTNPYDFVFNDLNTIAYIADSTLGVQKFTWSGTAWNFAYNITTPTTGLTGLEVDFSGENPVVFAVNPSNLYSYTDVGAGQMTSIATAGANYAFRGLAFSPVPEPSTWALIGLGSAFVLWRIRRKVATRA